MSKKITRTRLGEGLDKDQTDGEALRKMRDEDIDLSDIPELDKNFWKNAKVVRPDPTQQVTLRVKRSVLNISRPAARVTRPA